MIRRPHSSVSTTAVRRKVITTVPNRMNSSTAVPMRPSKSSINQARCSGNSVMPSTAKLEVCLVVSVAATDISTKNAPSWASSSRSPSISACTRPVNKSSVGFARRSSYICAGDLVQDRGRLHLHLVRRAPLQHLRDPAQATMSAAALPVSSHLSSRGTPMISQKVIMGSFSARSTAKSIRPAAAISSTSCLAVCLILSSMRFTCFGVNALETRLRSLRCWGSSMARNDCVMCRNSGGSMSKMTPWPEM